MRTTLDIDDQLLLESKKLADHRGCSVDFLVGEALSAFLAARDRDCERKEFRIPTFDPGAAAKDSLPAEFYRLEEVHRSSA